MQYADGPVAAGDISGLHVPSSGCFLGFVGTVLLCSQRALPLDGVLRFVLRLGLGFRV